MDRYKEGKPALKRALSGGLYIAITIDVIEGP
jgi:hypothetical protein